eukprot:5971229-Pyramimonas_sp.AAC.1
MRVRGRWGRRQSPTLEKLAAGANICKLCNGPAASADSFVRPTWVGRRWVANGSRLGREWVA